MLTDCLTCQSIDRCDQSDRWDSGCINYKMMPTKNPSNADRIRHMTDEELAEWIAGYVLNLTGGLFDLSEQSWLNWLKSPVEQEVDNG